MFAVVTILVTTLGIIDCVITSEFLCLFKGYRPALMDESAPLELKYVEKEIFGNLEEIYQWHTW